MRIAIIGRQAFGKSVFEAFLARGDEVAGVFCAPEKPGARPDPLRLAAGAATQTGLTIFRPTDGLDEGPILLQKTVAIGPDDTLGGVYFDRLFPMGVAAMLEAADLVVTGRHTEIPQDESLATYEGRCRDAEAEINWYGSVEAIYNLIRGCIPTPGAWTTVHERKVRILEARKHVARRFADVAGKPGEITAIGTESIIVTVQGGSLELLKVRIEGSEKSSAAAFCTALGLVVGSRLNVSNPTAQEPAKEAARHTARPAKDAEPATA